MDPGSDRSTTLTSQPRGTRDMVVVQFLLGLILQFLIALPFLRRTHGLQQLRPGRRCLLVVNHISLLDTLLLSTLCWRTRSYPILVLGDKKVWHASWIRRFLSRRTAFLLAGLAGLERVSEATRRDQAAKLGVDLDGATRWTRAIDEAARLGNPTLVALLAGLGMQGESWDKMTPRYLYHIVGALHRVGLDGEARMIAAEAVARG